MSIKTQKRKTRIFRTAIFVFALVFVVAAAVFLSFNFIPRPYRQYLAGLMPTETITPEDLSAQYSNKKLKILLVPGHDNLNYGTEFRGVREADLNREVAKNLYDLLAKDGHFQVFTARDFATGEYAPIFASYFESQNKEILSSRARWVEAMINTLKKGQFKMRANIDHSIAPSGMAQKLYGINKWANETNVDIVLHMHFNDYAGRPSNRVGEHSGFAIYVPEKQFSNARASTALAKAIFEQMKTRVAISTISGERRGIVEDQELVAIGANGSLNGAALLVEYGYIYESHLTSALSRDIMRELAYQTYLGLKKYFEPRAVLADTTLLPYQWESPLKKGMRASRGVLSLQFALHSQGVFPPPGRGLEECPFTGNFGDCTEEAVLMFQKKYADEVLNPLGLSRGTGQAGSATLKKLQELYPVE